MKKLFILLLLIPFISLAQSKSTKKPVAKKKVEQPIAENPNEETMLRDKDFVTDADGTHGNRRTIRLNDGSEKPVETSFLFSGPAEKFKSLGTSQINLIIHTANYRTVLAVKNKYTYQPRKVSLFYSVEKQQWTCAIEYTAQNDYGALKDGTIFYIYDETGNFVESLGR